MAGTPPPFDLPPLSLSANFLFMLGSFSDSASADEEDSSADEVLASCDGDGDILMGGFFVSDLSDVDGDLPLPPTQLIVNNKLPRTKLLMNFNDGLRKLAMVEVVEEADYPLKIKEKFLPEFLL